MYDYYIIYLNINGIKNIFTMVIPLHKLGFLKVLCPKIFLPKDTSIAHNKNDINYITFNAIIDRNLYDTMIKIDTDFRSISNNI